MEEMNKEAIENGVTEIVEEATEKLTFKQDLAAYALATIFGVGVATVGYGAYKGTKAMIGKIKNKKKISEESDQEVIDVEEENIHEVKDNESEQN